PKPQTPNPKPQTPNPFFNWSKKVQVRKRVQILNFTKMQCGGFNQGRAPTAEEQQIAKKHKADVEQKVGKTFTKFDITEVQTQVVAGTNFDFVADTNSGKVSFRVFRPLPGQGDTKLSSASIQA